MIFTLILENLGCPNCAAKMERGVRKLPYVREAGAVYVTKTMVVDADCDGASLVRDVADIAHRFEPEVNVVLKKVR